MGKLQILQGNYYKAGKFWKFRNSGKCECIMGIKKQNKKLHLGFIKYKNERVTLNNTVLGWQQTGNAKWW
jgi:hypothetical protein